MQRRGCTKLIGRTRAELDLLDTRAVGEFFQTTRPDYVLLAAAKVGGIEANRSQPVDFLLQNLQIQNNIISSAFATGVRKLLFLGSSCIYPKEAPQPIREEHLLTGPLEPTNEWYALAKIAGIKLCQAFRRQHGCDYISAMPTNLYGPNDNYDLQSSHVLPALIRKFTEARESGLNSVECWGSGTPRREFLHADDLADACLHLLDHYSEESHINVGSGSDVSIRELAELVREITGFQGEIRWDTTRPDGTMRKLMDSSRMLAMGWRPKVSLREGIEMACRDYQQLMSSRAKA